jgi:hypothetical protein
MSPVDGHDAERSSHATDGSHDDATHRSGASSGSGHGHGHDEAGERLGPVDVVAWTYAAGGAAIGVVTALALFVASGR